MALLVELLASGWSAAVEITPLTPTSAVGIDHGAVVVRCTFRETATWHFSRGAVLELGLSDAERDVVLATAHGLPADDKKVLRECVIVGANRVYRIESVWRATSQAGEQEADWSVLLTKRRLDRGATRLQLGQVAPDGLVRLMSEQAHVHLLSTNATLQQRDCLLRMPSVETADRGRLIYYSCRTSPGLSGSPIVASLDGRVVMIAMHLGWGFDYAAGRLRPVGIGRPIDAEIAAAIIAAGNEAGRTRRVKTLPLIKSAGEVR